MRPLGLGLRQSKSTCAMRPLPKSRNNRSWRKIAISLTDRVGQFSLSAIDSMTMSAPRTRVDLVVPKPTKKAREKGAEQ
jgi:hypothetical protein